MMEQVSQRGMDARGGCYGQIRSPGSDELKVWQKLITLWERYEPLILPVCRVHRTAIVLSAAIDTDG